MRSFREFREDIVQSSSGWLTSKKEMEISCVFGNRFQPIILSHPPSNFIPSASSTATTVTSDSSFRPTIVSTNYSSNFSVSYKTRQTAILDIQQSSDLDSALASFLVGCNKMGKSVLLPIAVI